MSNYNNNNANIRIVQIIQQLQLFNKKPSLNDKISDYLDYFHESINKEQINFAEAGLFIQESSVFNGKQIDLLYKGFLECHTNLSNVYNDVNNKQEQKLTQNEATSSNTSVVEAERKKKERKKHDVETTKVDEQLKDKPNETNVQDVNLTTTDSIIDLTDCSAPEKFSIPGIPDEILEKLNLSDCLPGGPIDEFIDKLDASHPLYSIINKLGKEISQNKDIFTYNNLSLSGMSWNALFKIEEVLSRITKKDTNDDDDADDDGQCQGTQTDYDDSGICSDHYSGGFTGQSSELFDNAASTLTTLPDISDNINIEEPNNSDHLIVEKQPEQHKIMDEALKKIVEKDCLEKVVQINLLKLDFKLLTKKFNFRLPAEYFVERKSERVNKRKTDAIGALVPLKRNKVKDNLRFSLRARKSFDLELFENFCNDFYESQGIIIPRPEPIEMCRKSIDNRSEVSYGNPLTPADSGRFSLSYFADSDTDLDHCRDGGHPFSRADSGIEVMGPFSPGSDHPDDTDHEADVLDAPNDTLKTLRTLFPATFSDPERAEALKTLYKQPEDDENYVAWKRFIEEKTANEKEFNIHEYGTDILNTFALESANQIDFKTIVNDKSVEDISRYFVSTLELANTYNVEIVDKYPGEIRADSMQLKFLSNTRAHEEIDSHFNDISEDHFFDNLIGKKFHSTPVHDMQIAGPSLNRKLPKRRRLEYCY